MESVTDVELAWDLLTSHRGCLTVAEWHAVSISLAIGEYQLAVYDILAAVVREREPITAASAQRLAEVIRVYEYGTAVSALLDEAIDNTHRIHSARLVATPRPRSPRPVHAE